MVLHSTLSGTDLHNPLGHNAEGALAIPANTSDAYRIEDDSANSSSLFAIDTTTGSERIWVGSSGATGKRVYVAMLAHTTDTGAPTAPSAGGCIYVKYNGISAYNVFVKGSDNTEYQLNTSASGAPAGAQYVTLATDATLTAERVLTGTSNQITITDNGAGSTVVLSTPQDIHTSATPTFAAITISGTSVSTINVPDATAVALDLQVAGGEQILTVVTTGTAEKLSLGSTSQDYPLFFYSPTGDVGAYATVANAAGIYPRRPGGGATTVHLYAEDSDGTDTLITNGYPSCVISDNTASAFSISDGTQSYISIVTTTSNESVTVGDLGTPPVNVSMYGQSVVLQSTQTSDQDTGLWTVGTYIHEDYVQSLYGETGIRTGFRDTTASATPAATAIYTLETHHAYLVTARVVARATSGTDQRMGMIIYCVAYRVAGGAVIQSQGTLVDVDSDGSWGAQFTVSGNDLQVEVTGDGTDPCGFKVHADITRVSDGAGS